MGDDLVWDMPETMKMANANPQSQDVEIVRKVVKKEESVLRSVLMQKVALLPGYRSCVGNATTPSVIRG